MTNMIASRTRAIAILTALALALGLLVAAAPQKALAEGQLAAGAAGTADAADAAAGSTDGAQLGTQTVMYPLWIAGKRVTSVNAKNVLGNDTVSYSPSTNTITLKNAKIRKARVGSQTSASSNITIWSNYGIHSDSTKKLTVKLVGKSKITMPSKKSPVFNYGIWSKGNIVIGGTGSLSVAANKAQAFSLGIATTKGLVVQGSAKVSAKGVATKITQERINYASNYGGYGVAAKVVTMKGKAKLTAAGAKLAFYKDYSPAFKFAPGYTPKVKAGASAKSIKVSKNSPAKSVYTKYKYVSIAKAAASSKKPAKMKITSVTAQANALKFKWKVLTKKCTGYQLQLSKSAKFASGSTWTYKTTNTSYNSSTLSSLSAGTTYYARIRGFNTVGSKTYYGAWSAVKSGVPYSAAG